MADLEVNKVKKARLGEMSCALFNRHHFLSKTPLLVTESTCNWAPSRWSKEYLDSQFGNQWVEISSNRKGVFDYNQGSSTGVVKKKSLPFSEALDLIFSDTGYMYYIQQQNIKKQFPQLPPAAIRPELLDQWKIVETTNLWISGKGCKTPLHYDSSDNFLVQLMGKKHITLFPPSESANLYPAVDDSLPHCSRINIFYPDLSSFPLYMNAIKSKSEFDLHPGDMLYIPIGWWHAVESVETSASINFWWRSIT